MPCRKTQATNTTQSLPQARSTRLLHPQVTSLAVWSSSASSPEQGKVPTATAAVAVLTDANKIRMCSKTCAKPNLQEPAAPQAASSPGRCLRCSTSRPRRTPCSSRSIQVPSSWGGSGAGGTCCCGRAAACSPCSLPPSLPEGDVAHSSPGRLSPQKALGIRPGRVAVKRQPMCCPHRLETSGAEH